jgi:ABC-type Fe3+/spermidine/putrescine transport system ATPase subunit
VTHDPLLALLSDRRIVMKNGAVEKILEPKEREKETLARISEMDGFLSLMREKIRAGDLLDREVPVP